MTPKSKGSCWMVHLAGRNTTLMFCFEMRCSLGGQHTDEGKDFVIFSIQFSI
jgi:hypothetical protein